MTAGKPVIPTEAEANAMGFTVTRNSQRWWDICSQRSRPFVAVRYRRGGKYAEVWSDAIRVSQGVLDAAQPTCQVCESPFEAVGR